MLKSREGSKRKLFIIVGMFLTMIYHMPIASSVAPGPQQSQSWWGKIAQFIAPVTRYLPQSWQDRFFAPVITPVLSQVAIPTAATQPAAQPVAAPVSIQPPGIATSSMAPQSLAMQKRIEKVMPGASVNLASRLTQQPTASSASTASFSAPAQATQEDLLEKMDTAIWKNDYRQVQQLLDGGVDPNGRRKKGDSPLEMALFWNRPDIVKLLLDRGADPNGKNKEGQPLIDTMVKQHNLALFRLLKEKGAKVAPAVAIGALEYYTLPAETDNLRQWLEAGLDPNSQSSAGRSLIEYVLDRYQPNVDVVRLLLAYGASPNAALIRILQNAFRSHYSSVEKQLTLLFDAGLDPNSTVDGNPLLISLLSYIPHEARLVLPMLSLLFSAGANPNSTSPQGVSALEYVINANMGQAIVQKLLDSGANITEKVFAKAVHKGVAKIVVAALKQGLSPNYFDKDHQGPVLDIALEGKQEETARYLLEKGARPTQHTLLYALMAAMPAHFIEKLLNAGANPNVMFPENGPRGKVTLVEFALLDSQPDIAILLLDKGASLPATDAHGKSWIQYAYKIGSVELMKALIKRGFSLDVPDNEGQTPLLRAIIDKKPEWIEFLINLGADPTIEGTYGNAFDLAENNPQLLAVLKRSKYSQKEGQKERYTPRLAAAYQAAGRSRNISEQVTSVAQYHEASGRTTSEVYRDIFQEEILEKYGMQLLEENRINILQLLNRERTYLKTHYAFYHAQNAAHRIAQDFWQKILALMQLGDVPDFIPVRFSETQGVLQKTDQKSFFTNTGIIPKCVPDDSHKKYNDNNSEIRKHLLSVNIALFGNIFRSGESSLAYYLENRSIMAHATKDLLLEIFTYYDFNQGLVKPLVDLSATSIGKKFGSMLQIFIPKDTVNQAVYLARAWGCAYTDDLGVGGYDSDLKYQAQIRPVLDLIQSGAVPTEKLTKEVLSDLQARIVLGKDIMLNPDSGVKIFREVDLPTVVLSWYRTQVESIARKVIIDWLVRYIKPKEESVRIAPEVAERIKGTPFGDLLTDRKKAIELLVRLMEQERAYRETPPPGKMPRANL